MKLQDKRVLITGGSRGIGKAIAQAYLREGAKVMLSARSKEELDATKKELSEEFSGATVEICVADVSRAEDTERSVKATIEAFGGLDVVVNAAGIYGPIGPSATIDFEKWKQTFEVNLFGTFNTIQHALRVMAPAKHGKIINFSGGGDGPLANFSAYSASKVAVVRLTETLAEEFKGYNVEINAIAPGPVNTTFLDEALKAGKEAVGEERYKKLIAQKESGGVSPEKAAQLCVILPSSASDGLSGKFLSAQWDDWKNWDKQKIAEIMASDKLTLRRK